ncbi:DEAD/DEAH box helicase [[Mycoplasma] cavipharyngis]|uniref:DEAD/DEAH box helicase n=1 Tax=[Mycoplasma] cavipharyngis TaxID=92757 RepID=UPI003704073C
MNDQKQWKLHHQIIIDQLLAQKYLAPNSLQEAMLLNLSQKGNHILVAPTGMGKTLGLTIYLVDFLLSHPNLQAFFVFPTKELIQQVFRICKQLSFNQLIEISQLNHKIKINNLLNKQLILTTPKQLQDFGLMMQKEPTKSKMILVLDEVDTLIEAGFLNDIQTFMQINKSLIIKKIAASATIRKGLMQQLKIWFKTYHSLIFNSKKITNSQHYYLITRKEKKNQDFLTVLNYAKNLTGTIVFFNNQEELVSTYQYLITNSEIRPIVLYGKMSHRERTKAMNLIHQRDLVIIFATDLLARGISIKHVQTVINYSLPKDQIWYLHRSGRTGRYQQPGKIINLITDQEFIKINQLTKKSLKFFEVKILANNLVFKDRSYQKKSLNPQLSQQIKQIIAQADKRVKPNYKKKLKNKIKAAKNKVKRQQIEAQVKQKLINKWKQESIIKKNKQINDH